MRAAPDEGEVEQTADSESQRAEAEPAQNVLRSLAEAGQKRDGEQVQKAASETSHAILRAAEPPRPVMHGHLRDAKAAGICKHRDEPVQLAIEANLGGHFRAE